MKYFIFLLVILLTSIFVFSSNYVFADTENNILEILVEDGTKTQIFAICNTTILGTINIKNLETEEIITNNIQCGESEDAFEADLDEGDYEIVININEPCNDCSKIKYFHRRKTESLVIPDNNLLVVVLIIFSITLISFFRKENLKK
jgi:hypothetical protein